VFLVCCSRLYVCVWVGVYLSMYIQKRNYTHLSVCEYVDGMRSISEGINLGVQLATNWVSTGHELLWHEKCF